MAARKNERKLSRRYAFVKRRLLRPPFTGPSSRLCNERRKGVIRHSVTTVLNASVTNTACILPFYKLAAVASTSSFCYRR